MEKAVLSAVPIAASSAPSLELDPSIATWSVLGALVIAMLAIDLVVFARDHTPPVREAAAWSVAWLAVAAGFGALFWAWQGGEAGGQFFAGYLLERTLSLDNVFVFAVIMAYFAVPAAVQPKVLSWGIALALVLRLVLILAGAALLDAFHATFYVFGALLLFTAWKLVRREGQDAPPDRNRSLRLLPRRLRAKPLVVVFVVVATTDLVFAVDSIPAIFAVTSEPFVVFAANAFAMLGLRALYFLLAGMMDRFVYLSHGLALILVFIGTKMLLIDVWHPPIWLSLGVIVAVLAATVVLSLRAEPEGSAA
jgi:predicted tellurium resistance membrane protein TerC